MKEVNDTFAATALKYNSGYFPAIEVQEAFKESVILTQIEAIVTAMYAKGILKLDSNTPLH